MMNAFKSLWTVAVAAVMASMPSALAHELSFDELEVALADPEKGLRSVEDVLKWLKADHPSYLGSFSLMYESESLQGASFANPRVILYGDDASLLMTFNGSSDQAGYDRLELIQFRNDERSEPRFEFREVVFDPMGGKAQVSSANPAKCLRCHGTDPSPIWEPYDQWPGAYGSDDDAMIDVDRSRWLSPRVVGELREKHRRELKHFRAFMASKDEHARYRFLEFRGDSPIAPYTESIRSGSDPLRPNLRLSRHLTALNAKVVNARLMENRSCYSQTAALLTAQLIGCRLEDSVSDKLDQMEAMVSESYEHHYQRAELRPWTSFASNQPLFEQSALIELMGLDISQWNLGRNPPSWSYFEGAETLGDFVAAELFNELAKQLEGLPPYLRIRQYRQPSYYPVDSMADSYTRQASDEGYNAAYPPQYNDLRASYLASCQMLVDESYQQLQSASLACAPSEISEVVEPPKTVRMCMSCHGKDEESSIGPYLPLDDLPALHAKGLASRVWNRLTTTNERRRMPPDRALTKQEMREVSHYLGLQ